MKFISNFNMSHYIKVLRERDRLGIRVFKPPTLFEKSKNSIDNHPLIGRKILNTIKNKIYTIDKVTKNWHRGYYITIYPVDDNRSHASVFWKIYLL